jgi:nucleolar protein 53
VPEPRLEILLPEDVPESLRRLKPEGNLLHDRYRSLVVRGKVESRRSTQQKKAKTKRTEKWSYKDWRLK